MQDLKIFKKMVQWEKTYLHKFCRVLDININLYFNIFSYPKITVFCNFERLTLFDFFIRVAYPYKNPEKAIEGPARETFSVQVFSLLAWS